MHSDLRRVWAAAALVGVLALVLAPVAPASAATPRLRQIAGVVRLIAPAGAMAPIPSARVVRDLPGGSVAIDVPTARALEAYRQLAGRYGPDAVRADTVARLDADHVPADPFWPDMWWAKQIGMSAAWGTSLGSPDVVIGILDSGVNEAADLTGAVLPGKSFVDGAPDVTDPQGHGTMVAQIAAARIDNGMGGAGVCPRCSILPVKVAGPEGFGWTSDIDAGIVWAVDHGATVINVSLGSQEGAGVDDAVVRYARSAGVSVVAAAGNKPSTTPEFPADTPGVVSVAATDEHDAIESWSTRGTWVDLAAPGDVKVASTQADEWWEASGTSFSAPMVAGALGLLASAFPASTMVQREDALTSTAAAVAPPGTIAGGRIDVGKALAMLATQVAASPPPTQPVVGAPVIAMTAPTRAVTYTRAAAVDVAWTETLLSGETVAARAVVQEATPVAGGVCDADAWSAEPEAAAPEAAAFRSGTLADGTCYRWRIHVVDGSGRTADSLSGTVLVDRRKPAIRSVLPRRLTTTSAGTLTFRWAVDDGDAGSGAIRTTVVSERGRPTARGCGGWTRYEKQTVPYVVTDDAYLAWGPVCVRLKVTVVDAAGNVATTTLPAYRHR
jgi:thermitase